MKQKDVKKFWQAQRDKERKQLQPLAEKIAKAIVKCSKTIEQDNEQEKRLAEEQSINTELTKLKSNFNFQFQWLLERIENENCDQK